jgi:hypothetical protein
MKFLSWVAASLVGVTGLLGNPPAVHAGSTARSDRKPLYAPHHPYEIPARASVGRRPKASESVSAKEAEKTGEPTAAEAKPKAPSMPGADAQPPGSQGVGAKKQTPVPPPFQPPEPPLTPEQRTRLAELLEAYKADRLTPEEYHRERARILSEGVQR